MTQQEYDAFADRIKRGQGVQYNGRSAATIEELDFMRNAENNPPPSGAVPLMADPNAVQRPKISRAAITAELAKTGEVIVSEGDSERLKAFAKGDRSNVKVTVGEDGLQVAVPDDADFVIFARKDWDTVFGEIGKAGEQIAALEEQVKAGKATAASTDTENGDPIDDGLDAKTKNELLDIAKERNIKLESDANKATIVKALREKP
jgi:hypothetical protein